MLSVHQISKSYGTVKVLNKVSFNLNRGEKIGLVGPNGCGKSTLLRILAGVEKPDSGSFHLIPPSIHPGYLPQGQDFSPDDTLGTFLSRWNGDLQLLEYQLSQLANDLAAHPDRGDLQQQYDSVLASLQETPASLRRRDEILAAFDLGQTPLDFRVVSLSGGQKTRLALAAILLSNPQLLLLDEPTNHLDIDMLEWLEEWLEAYPGGVLIVSHDRTFLDHTVSEILELDPVDHQARLYAGNYSEYAAAKESERNRHWQEYSDQQGEISRLNEAARHLRGLAKFKRGGKADTRDGFARGFFANRSLGTVGRAKQIERRLEKLMTEERIEKPQAGWQMKLDFDSIASSGREVLLLDDLSIGYGEKELLRGLNLGIKQGKRVVLTGPNGSGKTTLLKTIQGEVPPLSGSYKLGTKVILGYMAQEQENLDQSLNALDTMRRLVSQSETEIRAFLSFYLFTGDDVFIPVEQLSYGERARLSLACFVASGCNFLLLDEPINHLDIPSRLRFEQALSHYQGTILAVGHDRYFIEAFATEIWRVEDQGIRIYWPKTPF
ncbi:MAG: ATP-binding cassette domain-containing protein [Chloroflexi bacterium]|nr:ATP-binding cassette domain-containing protein [Chloroflexota bacterium]